METTKIQKHKRALNMITIVTLSLYCHSELVEVPSRLFGVLTDQLTSYS